MWTYVFRRTRALINIALHRYMFPVFNNPLSLSDMETLVEFEKVVEGEFELASDELLRKAFGILRYLYSRFQQKEISSNSTKETALLLQAVCGKETPLDYENLDDMLSDENFKRGLNGLEAEFFVLSTEIKKFRESPRLYHRVFRQAKRFYFEFNRDTLDPDGKIMRALYAVDETELIRESIFCWTHVGTHPGNNSRLSDLCLHAILDCRDVRMIEDFVATKKRGRRPNDSVYEHVKKQLSVWVKCGAIKQVPTKNRLYKVLQKLRTNPYVKLHLQRLKKST